MRISISLLLFAAAFAAAASGLHGCGTETCGSQADCPVGFYCVLSFNSGRAEGGCQQDCATSADCAQPESNALRAVCTNEGRCRTEGLPPRLVVLEPEPDDVFDEGTQRVRVTGEVEMAAAQALITVTTAGNRGCGTGISRQATITNETGEFASIPFVVDDVFVDPGNDIQLIVEAAVPGAVKRYPLKIEVACPGCAEIRVADPQPNQTGVGLALPRLAGNVDKTIGSAIWRVRGLGGVLDGALPIENGRNFAINDLPLFPGNNRLEVLVTGVGTGRGESRCSILVNAGVSAERGLRAILTWDGNTSDLDLHLIGDGGRYGDASSSLSSRSRVPLGFSGTVMDDFDGLGPEVLTAESLPDGAYGLIVEAVFDDLDPGSTAFLRLLFNGETLTVGPIGPQYLQAFTGDLWVAGVLSIDGGQASFLPINEMLDATMPPVTPPQMWPAFF